MNNSEKPDLEFEGLLEVLDQVRDALKNGTYEDLSQSVNDQNQLIAILENRPHNTCLTEYQAKRLSQSARHNQRLIKATLAGLRSARRRKEDVAEAQKNSLIYDRSGKTQGMTGSKVTLEKRR